MKFKRHVIAPSFEAVTVRYSKQLILNSQKASAVLDGVTYKAKCGCWMFYLPAVKAKFFHASNGTTDCIHVSRPAEAVLRQDGNKPLGRYCMDEWRRALTTPVTRRLAEMWIVSVRLWKAGLGPQPLGVCFVDRYVRDNNELGATCGILIQDVFSMPRKLRCKLEHIQAAGVIPDKILSCVRRQVRGYVVDLSSVVGCVPGNAERAISRLEHVFLKKENAFDMKQALNETFSLYDEPHGC